MKYFKSKARPLGYTYSQTGEWASKEDRIASQSAEPVLVEQVKCNDDEYIPMSGMVIKERFEVYEKEIARLQRALRFYGKEDNYTLPDGFQVPEAEFLEILIDMGKKARKALKRK